MNAYEYIKMLSDINEAQRLKIDHFIKQYEKGFKYVSDVDRLSAQTANFKGNKPISVTLPNGSIYTARRWKDVAITILEDCLKDGNVDNLFRNVDEIWCRNRILMARNKSQMHSPLEVADGVYFESYFDTESLLAVMKDYVLKPLGYDIDNVIIEYADNEFFTQARSQSNGNCDMQMKNENQGMEIQGM